MNAVAEPASLTKRLRRRLAHWLWPREYDRYSLSIVWPGKMELHGFVRDNIFDIHSLRMQTKYGSEDVQPTIEWSMV